MDDSLTITLKVSLSNNHNTHFVLATTVAALGALYRSASSPNESPGKYCLTKRGSESF